jgi:hypothetical protein
VLIQPPCFFCILEDYFNNFDKPLMFIRLIRRLNDQ